MAGRDAVGDETQGIASGEHAEPAGGQICRGLPGGDGAGSKRCC